MNIDDALRAYVDRPVPLGMEVRILRRIRRRPWRWPVLALTTAGLCTLMIVPQPGRRGDSRVVRVPQHPAVAAVHVIPEALPPHRKRHRQNGVEALWRFAQKHPEAALQLTEFHEPEPVVPLEIQPISITELGDTQQ